MAIFEGFELKNALPQEGGRLQVINGNFLMLHDRPKFTPVNPILTKKG